MTGGLWNRVRQGLGLSRGAGSLPTRNILDHLEPLAEGGRDLPAEALRYVEHGDGSHVLTTLSAAKLQQAWRRKHNIYPLQDKAKLFADPSLWQPGQMRRLGEIVASVDPITWDYGYFGTKKSPDWLRHIVSLYAAGYEDKRPVSVLLDLVEGMAEPTQLVLDMVFCRGAAHYGVSNSIDRFTQVDLWLGEAHKEVEAALPAMAADARVEVAAAIGRFGLHGIYLPLLLDGATGSSKKLRAAATRALTGMDRDGLGAALEERFAKAPPGRRAELVEVAATALGDAAAPLLARWREGEQAAKVIAALDRVAGATQTMAEDGQVAAEPVRPDGPDGYTAADGSRVTVEPAKPLPGPTPLPDALFAVIEPAMAEFNRQLEDGKAEATADRTWHWSRQHSRKDRRDFDALAALVQGTEPLLRNGSAPVVSWMQARPLKGAALAEFLNDPRLTLYHLVRLAVAVGNGHFQTMYNDWSGPVGAAMVRRLGQGADLRVVWALWRQAGGEDYILNHLAQRWYAPMMDLETPIWPYLCQHWRDLDEAVGLGPQTGAEPMRLLPAFDLLETFPKLPERYRSRLMLLANDSSRQIRDRARALLRHTPGLGGAIALQLQDGRQETRALAADWLAARGETTQAAAIHAALRKERSDLARAAMITGLERLSEDVSRYFDPQALVKDATAGLAKPSPKGLEWFPLDHLPALTWANGSPVDPVLPRWWVVLAARLKQPGGNALMSLWLDRLAPGDAHRLGWMILTGWIEKDTLTPSDEDANAFALANVDAVLQQHLKMVQSYPQSADYWSVDRDVVFAQLKRNRAGTYLDSAADSKGILALAARVNGADAAQRVRAFLKDHGQRTSQGKSLLEVLAAIGTSAALQAVLAAANRSKQRSVQAHAALLVEQIAERNGWSAAQLADRTIPTGGFEMDGTQDLDCGDNRSYRLHLDGQDAVTILNGDGREVKALPGVRVDADKPLIDAAKKQLATARKEVKQVLAAQTARLQEAMYLQRGWDVTEWESFIAGHPIVGWIAARLIWQGVDADGRPGVTFRPLGDGSYSDATDGDVDLAGLAQIRLAHSSLLDAQSIAAWRGHLADYAVPSPFDQLGRNLPVMLADQGAQRSVTDREGWMIETFKLRGIATKLGYQRGQAQDGGWFLTYEKAYREAGLVVEIEFTGSPLPEENRVAALQALCFRKLRANGQGGAQIALGDVPPVLLAESWRDLHDMADKGSGFDADWSRKV